MLVGFQNQGIGVIIVHLETYISTKKKKNVTKKSVTKKKRNKKKRNQNVFYRKYLSKLQRDD